MLNLTESRTHPVSDKWAEQVLPFWRVQPPPSHARSTPAASFGLSPALGCWTTSMTFTSSPWQRTTMGWKPVPRFTYEKQPSTKLRTISKWLTSPSPTPHSGELMIGPTRFGPTTSTKMCQCKPRGVSGWKASQINGWRPERLKSRSRCVRFHRRTSPVDPMNGRLNPSIGQPLGWLKLAQRGDSPLKLPVRCSPIKFRATPSSK